MGDSILSSDTKKIENFFDSYAYDFDSIYGSLKKKYFY